MALGRLGDASAVTHLKSVLRTTQERVLDANTGKMRLSVVGALGRLGHKGALEPLQKMVEQQGVDRQDMAPFRFQLTVSTKPLVVVRW